jgi:Ser-tRNA(Ala) deacylase AlaX
MNKSYPPEMHTAEHILNGTMVKMFDRGRSFSAHIEKKKSKCDYRFDRDLTPEERTEIERRVNEVILSEVNVTEEYISRTAAENLYNLERLPEYAGDEIRIIKVGDYDACPCIGQHVSNTKEIGQFKIISSSFEEGVMRLRFRVEGKS